MLASPDPASRGGEQQPTVNSSPHGTCGRDQTSKTAITRHPGQRSLFHAQARRHTDRRFRDVATSGASGAAMLGARPAVLAGASPGPPLPSALLPPFPFPPARAAAMKLRIFLEPSSRGMSMPPPSASTPSFPAVCPSLPLSRPSRRQLRAATPCSDSTHAIGGAMLDVSHNSRDHSATRSKPPEGPDVLTSPRGCRPRQRRPTARPSALRRRPAPPPRSPPPSPSASVPLRPCPGPPQARPPCAARAASANPS